jgi:hypothetical protein
MSLSMFPCPHPCPCPLSCSCLFSCPSPYILHVYVHLQVENGTNGKRQIPFICCKQKTETANFRLLAANGNG